MTFGPIGVTQSGHVFSLDCVCAQATMQEKQLWQLAHLGARRYVQARVKAAREHAAIRHHVEADGASRLEVQAAELQRPACNTTHRHINSMVEGSKAD